MSSTSDLVDLPPGLSKDIENRLRNHLERERKKAKTWDRTNGKVSKQLCRLIHDLYDDGMYGTEIAEILPVGSQNTIYYHLRGECTHQRRDKVKYDECGWMRFHAHNGAPSKTLGVLYNCSQRVVSRHITGKCRHGHMLEPIDPQELRKNSHTGPKMTTSVCAECGEEFEHEAYRDRTTCNNSCNQIYAARKGAEALNKERWSGKSE